MTQCAPGPERRWVTAYHVTSSQQCEDDEFGLTLEENVLVTSKCLYTVTHPTRLYLKNTQIKNEYNAFSSVFFFFAEIFSI